MKNAPSLTVADLIKRLQAFPPETPVMIRSAPEDPRPVGAALYRRVNGRWLAPCGGFAFGAFPEDPGYAKGQAVRLEPWYPEYQP